MTPAIKLKRRERRILALLYPAGATIAIGLGAGDSLYRRGFVEQAKFGRWGITAEGRVAIEGYPADLKAMNGGTR